MTVIVGVAHKGGVTIGADSAGVGGMNLTVRRDSKLFRNGPLLVGFTSSFRMGQLLHHSFKPPPLPRRAAELERYMVVEFVDALRSTLKAGGYARVQSGQEEGGTFLVGVRGRLFFIEDDFQVGEARDGFHAVGCGAEVARGALFATQGQKPQARVRTALRAAERCNAGVRGPFLIEASTWPAAR